MLKRLLTLLRKGLEQTSTLWPAVRTAFAWVHQAERLRAVHARVLGVELPVGSAAARPTELAQVTEVVVPGGAIDGNGYRTSVGLRSGLTDRLEGLVKANYVDGDDFDLRVHRAQPSDCLQ